LDGFHGRDRRDPAGRLRVDVRASSSDGDDSGAALPVIEVSLSEFTVEPAMITVPTGGGKLRITNTGSMVHTLAIPEIGEHTGTIEPGASTEITIDPSVSDGHYEVLCDVAGHAASGMTAELMVGGTTTGDGMAATGNTMTWQEMDEAMDAVAKAFPAETAGHGGELLEPTVLPDGTKQYDLTAEIVQWEVEPGKLVEAWTYNGVVPAPEIHVEVGDRVRVVLTNNLSESTALHWHGIDVPNSMDGVDPYTQPAIKPGETYAYEFTAKSVAVGIYHSHHNAQVQVPNGMFGAFTIGDIPIPQTLIDQGYTTVDKKVNMVLNDAGTIGLSLNGKSFPATEPYTLGVGQVMMVNYYNEGLMAHPMHLHQPVGWVIAKDGVPLAQPIPSDTINVAPGERYTVLYKAHEPGVWAWHCHILNHAESSEGMFGMVTALIVE
jgi:FtsP/CotA-like multicopper oxidase with cupredoxin domain